MANLQYIGPRVVPKPYRNPDTGNAEWKSGIEYEALTMVTYLSNGYVSAKPVSSSVGNPADNPDYWVESADFDAALSDLQTRVSDLEHDVDRIDSRLLTIGNRKFVLIGDSFSCGIRGGGQSWVTGWANYFENLFPDNTFWYNPSTDEHFEGVSAFTSVSDKNFIGQLNYVYNNKLGTTAADEITDVVVLGGSNEGSSTLSQISHAIGEFCDRSRELFPNADISIGCFGLNARAMMFDMETYTGYKFGSMRHGVKFIEDLFNLGTLNQFDSGYGHFNENGYNFYNPFVAEAIVNGKVDFHFHQSFTLTLNATYAEIPAGTFNFDLTMDITNRGISFRLYDNNRYNPTWLKLVTKIAAGGATREGILFDFPEGTKLYTAFPLLMNLINAHYSLGDGSMLINIGEGGLQINKVSNEYVLMYKCGYPGPSNKLSDNTYDAYIIWDALGHLIDKQYNDQV